MQIAGAIAPRHVQADVQIHIQYITVATMKDSQLQSAYLSRVFFCTENKKVLAGSFLSPVVPNGEDFLLYASHQDLLVSAVLAFANGSVQTMEEFWVLYSLCSVNTTLVSYEPYSKDEIVAIYQNDGDLGGICADPFVVVPVE